MTCTVTPDAAPVAVAVKVCGDPAAPAAVAEIVAVPATDGSVTMVDAIPSAPLTEFDGLTKPLLGAMAQTTARPESGFPAWVTMTRSGLGSEVATAPLCPSPL